MQLTFLKPYKSIGHFLPFSLPDFAILTGVNGAGKTHLLQAIETGAVQIDDLRQTPNSRPIRLFDWTNLVPQDTGPFAPYQITQERVQFWNELAQQFSESRQQIVETLSGMNRPELLAMTPSELLGLTPEKLGGPADEAAQLVNRVKELVLSRNKDAVERFIRNDQDRLRLIGLLSQNVPEPLITLGEDAFYTRFPKSWKPIDVFQQSFARLFADYRREWLNNALRELRAKEDPTVKPLTNDEFIKEHGEAPWDFVNEILKTAALDFRINQPAKYEDKPYRPTLFDQVTHAEVGFNDLSSGEKILMSFAFCVYYAQDRRQLVNYPKVLLFDEIDAPLHPSMAKSLLRTITDVLLNRLKIKVILTTHAPSTAALADEDALYAMFKTAPRIEKTTKDKVLAVLTAGVPTLSIDYENRRQVFVESSNDAKCYDKIFAKLRKRLVPEISLTFIASGIAGKGNCDQVREVVNQLYSGGSRSVYGIIDWDLKNVGNDRVKVLGVESRYSIENYVLDPLLVAAFLIREKFVSPDELQMKEGETFLSFANMEDPRLQKIADLIVQKTEPHLSFSGPREENRADCRYFGGQKISLPTWFMKIQGHELEAALKEAFPHLKRFTKEFELKSSILSKIIDDLPELISRDFIPLFEAIQNFPAEARTRT